MEATKREKDGWRAELELAHLGNVHSILSQCLPPARSETLWLVPSLTSPSQHKSSRLPGTSEVGENQQLILVELG